MYSITFTHTYIYMQMYSSIFQYLDYKLACLLYEVIDARLARLIELYNLYAPASP